MTCRAAEPVWNDLNWDMSVADVKKLYPEAKESKPEPTKTLLSIGEVKLEGMPLNGGVAFDAEGKMRAILFWSTPGKWVDDHQASILQDAFYTKYGAPVSDSDERQRRQAKWSTKNGTILLFYVFSGKDPYTRKDADAGFYVEFQPPATNAPAASKKE